MTSLFVLILLMGGLSLVTCDFYEYKFIWEPKTWVEAQSYCQKHHTDLATLYDQADIQRLVASVTRETGSNGRGSWIGLHRHYGGKKTWYWSLPGEEFNMSRATGESQGIDFSDSGCDSCVMIQESKWGKECCFKNHSFFCYNETSKETIHINISRSWHGAQRYCRHKYSDLVSGHDQLKKFTGKPEESWIGLFKDKWEWSDGSHFSFRQWDLLNDNTVIECPDPNNCAVITDSGYWGCDKCDAEKSFFCYDDKLILVKQTKTWQEALDHCREEHDDLVSIAELRDQRWVQERAKNADTGYIWLGLRYTCTLGFWFWVNGEDLVYENWAPDTDSELCQTAVAMDTRNGHKWFHKSDEEKFNFICVK